MDRHEEFRHTLPQWVARFRSRGEHALTMLPLNPTRHPIFRKLSSGAAVGFFSVVIALLLPGIASPGATEVNDAELVKATLKTEQATESRVRRTISKDSMRAIRVRVARRTERNRGGSRLRHFHVRHSLPNGLRAPLRC